MKLKLTIINMFYFGLLWKHSHGVKMYACLELGPFPDENMETAATSMETCVHIWTVLGPADVAAGLDLPT